MVVEGIDECENNADTYCNVNDGEDFTSVSSGGKVTKANGGERNE